MTRSLAIIAILTISATAGADRKKHEERYCTALTAVHTDFTKLEGLGKQSKLSDLRAAVVQIEKDIKTVDREARKIRTDTSKEFVNSAERLYRETQSLPDSMTVEEARSRLADDLTLVKRNARTLASESGCPEAIPAPSAGSD